MKFFIVYLLLTSVSLEAPVIDKTEEKTREFYELCEQKGSDVLAASIIKLISNPSDYHGKCIMTRGYLLLEHEYSYVFLTKNDYESSNTWNAVEIVAYGDELNNYDYLNGHFIDLYGVVNVSHLDKGKPYHYIELTNIVARP